MNKLLYLVLLFLISVIEINAQKGNPRYFSFSLTNPDKQVRYDEPVYLSRKRILTAMKRIPSNAGPVVYNIRGTLVPVQAIDDDGDRIWDKILITINLNGGEREQFQLAFKPNSETSFPVRTHSRLGYAANRDQKYEAIDTNTRPIWWKPQMQPPLYQLEGPGWENDNVGFRIYFDARNGVDIFGKTTKRMVFDEIGIDSDYHKLQPWGMDVLKVGNSLGAGSLAFSKNGVLYRAGEKGGAYFRKGANGKEYSALSVIYQNDTCGGVVLDYSQTFSINAGKHYYKNDVCLKNYQDIDSVAIGIVTLKLTDESMVVKTKKGGRVLLTHGKQSENDDLLGMALYFPPSSPSSLEIIGKRETGVGSTALLITKAEEQMHYYFFGMWEKADARFATKTGCLNYVLSEVNKLENPLKVNGL